MNPLSPLAYHRRHKRRAFLLIALICVSTLGICITVRAFGFFAEQAEVAERYLTRFSSVSAIGPALEAGLVARIRADPGVAWVTPEKEVFIGTPLNTSGGFRLFGVGEDALPVLIDACDLSLKEGRLLRPRTNEIMLSEELVDSLGLQLGDEIGYAIDQDYYADIPTTMLLVGILEHLPAGHLSTDPAASLESKPPVFTGFVSYEYLDSHELYASRAPGLLVGTQQGRKAAVDRYLETEIASDQTKVWTLRQSSEWQAQAMTFLYLLFGIVDWLFAAVIALVVAAIVRIGLIQRIGDLGLLHAIGYHRRWLVRRLTLETGAVTGIGWMAGLVIMWLLLAAVKFGLCPPSMELNLANLTPIWFSAPVLLAVVAVVMFSTWRMFARLDAVSIIERGHLDAETTGRPRTVRSPATSPLSPWTFYRRHWRRGLMLTTAVALMIVGVTFPVFLFSPQSDVLRLRLEYLQKLSIVSPRSGRSLDPGVTAQVRTHPAVAQVIPAVELGLLIETPPLSRNRIWIYGVSEDHMQTLVELYGMDVEEGHLPRPRTNEIALSRTVVTNRGLQVGDSVGHPIEEIDSGIPTEMVVVGILSLASGTSTDGRRTDRLKGSRGYTPWLGFASYEYLRSHELYASRPVHLLVVSKENQKAELDTWLEGRLSSEQTEVRTYATALRDHRQANQILLGVFALVEGVLIVVAPITLAILSYTFFLQRREEFGILHAMGQSRRWLVLRTAGETASAVLVAWLVAAVIFVAGLVYIQGAVYGPKGLPLDFMNPTPWLFTIPLPLTVIAVSTGLVARVLSKLDPVSVIERR